jgi:hypothetical protein
MGSVKYQLLLCTLPGEQPLPGTITARGLRLELICGSYKNRISDILPCAAAAKKGGGAGLKNHPRQEQRNSEFYY